MKKISIMFAMFAALTIASCGGGKDAKEEGKDTTETAATPEPETTPEPEVAPEAPADTNAVAPVE